MTDYRYIPGEGEAYFINSSEQEWLEGLFGDGRNRGIGVHATPPPYHEEGGVRRATSVYLPGVCRTYHAVAGEEDNVFEEGGDIVYWLKEVRCLVHAAQFLQMYVTWYDGTKESFTYCGPFLIDWDSEDEG